MFNEVPFGIVEDEWYGFVYQITNNKTGKKYIGKKLFWHKKTKQVKGKKKRILVESDWRDYFGSNAELQNDVKTHGKNNFTRLILKLCKNKGECNYYETKAIFENDCLLKEDFYNQWVSCKIARSHLNAKTKTRTR